MCKVLPPPVLPVVPVEPVVPPVLVDPVLPDVPVAVVPVEPVAVVAVVPEVVPVADVPEVPDAPVAVVPVEPVAVVPLVPAVVPAVAVVPVDVEVEVAGEPVLAAVDADEPLSTTLGTGLSFARAAVDLAVFGATHDELPEAGDNKTIAAKSPTTVPTTGIRAHVKYRAVAWLVANACARLADLFDVFIIPIGFIVMQNVIERKTFVPYLVIIHKIRLRRWEVSSH